MRVLLLLAVLSLAAVEWREVTRNRQAVFSVADARTDRSRGEVRVWERVDFRETSEGRKYRADVRAELADRGVEDAAQVVYMTARHVYRCEEGQAAFEQFHYHARGGAVVTSDPVERLMRWESPPPDSIAEATMQDACRRPVEKQ